MIIDKAPLRGKTVTLDCNILLLYVIGSVDKSHISKFKRTTIFSEDDYNLLLNLLAQSTIVITPNVYTEASNLLESYNFRGTKLGLILLKDIIKIQQELYHDSTALTEKDSFLKYGLSDSSIEQLCSKDIVAITVDLSLYAFLVNKSYSVINFNHLRGQFN